MSVYATGEVRGGGSKVECIFVGKWKYGNAGRATCQITHRNIIMIFEVQNKRNNHKYFVSNLAPV